MIVRWSLEAREALYPDPSRHWWKPWPHWEETRQRNINTIMDAFGIPQSMRDGFAALRAERAT